MAKKFCCPKCGSKNLQITTKTHTQTHGKNYSAGQGCLGWLLFGPFGLLCGLCGQGKTTTTTNTNYWVCPDCGNQFKDPEEIKKQISQFNTPIFPIMAVLGVIFGFIMMMLFAGLDMGMGFFMFILFAGIFTAIGFGAKKMNDSNRAKLEDELDSLERAMDRFDNE